MWAAFMVLLGHSVIIHHHHEDTHQTASHHHHDHENTHQTASGHHHDHEENNDLSDLFSNFHHGIEGFQFTQHFDNLVANGANTTYLPFLVSELLSNRHIQFVLEEKVVKPPDIFSETFSTQIRNSSGLRGPPTFVV
jgi:hypothetical protein